ncbi:MAG: RNA polymerase sigma factor [Armatimonadota bacterium]
MERVRLEPHSDDSRLVSRACHGDQAAFRQLFETYSPLVYRIAYRMLESPDDAADLTQDVFVRAYERLPCLRDGQAFHAWITRMTMNMAHDRLRKRRPNQLSLDAPPPGREEGVEWALADESPGSEERVLAGEFSERVQGALAKLSPEHRAVVVLHHLEGMPVEEIGRILGVPTGTVKSRLARARAELKRRLEGYVGL